MLLVRPHALRENSNAFCFECGTFCNLDRALTSASAVCPECGGDFVQFLWRVQESNWISADDPGAGDFAFDDQLEDSISVSLAETPVPKKPTKKSFLQSLQPLHLDQSEVDARSRSRHSGDCSDPKSNCSICRDAFTVGDELHELPCHHEFHASCIRLWLQGSNTCPICRLQLPEADAEDEQLESKVLVGEEDKESDKEPDKERTLPLEPREELPVEEDGTLGDGSGEVPEEALETDVAWRLPGALGEVEGAEAQSEGSQSSHPVLRGEANPSVSLPLRRPFARSAAQHGTSISRDGCAWRAGLWYLGLRGLWICES